MDHSGKEKEALALMAEADKKMKTTRSMLGTFFGSSRLEEACELYVRAANMFKMAKNWNAAGEAFCRAAQLYCRGDSKHNAATCFLDAGNAFRKADAQEAVLCFGQAIDIYTDLGRFNMAAKHHTTVADIWESELLDIEKAASHYEQAADYYRGEESSSAANKCLLKVGIFAAQLEQYHKAIEIFEQIGTYSMDTTLLKYAAKDHFFRAALCHFCVDILNCKLAVQRYEEMFPAFSDARECRLLKKLLTAHEEQNAEGFAAAIQEFESITRLEQWHSALLLRIQSSIPDESNLR